MIDDVPPVVGNALVAELAPGERVLWYAMPSLRRKLRDPIITLLLGLCIAVLLVATVLIHHLASPLFQLGRQLEIAFDLIFVGAMSAAFVLIFLILWWVFRRTIYAITDRRAIVIHTFFRKRIQSFTGEQLTRAVRIEDKHGGGDILFERNSGFLGLKDVRAAAKLLRQTYEAGLAV